MASKMGSGGSSQGVHAAHGNMSATTTRKEPADSLDLSSFLNSLEQEVEDLHTAFKTRRDDRVEKAFQRVPRSMRRRTASHNAKRVPRRLRHQAHRDQAADNTPSVATGLAKRKKARPASAWVYENTKKRVRLQQEQKVARLGDDDNTDDDDDDDDDDDAEAMDHDGNASAEEGGGARLDGIAKDAEIGDDGAAPTKTGPRPPLPIKNLRLPTHRWQAKRAQMDCPGYLWNTTLVRTPANKTYRMSLRAASLRPGMCVCWDTSYMATIHLRGPARHLDDSLATVIEPHLLTSPSLRNGTRCLDAKLPRSFGYQQQQQQQKEGGASSSIELGGPGNCGAMTLFYNPADTTTTTTTTVTDDTERSVLLRVHPTIFSHVWTTLNNEVARKQLPVAVRDFRLEIGSIDMTGTAALETLASTLYPYDTPTAPMEPQGKEFLKLRTMDTTAVSSASGVMLAFNIQDPRLDEPDIGVQAANGPDRSTAHGQSSSSPLDDSSHSGGDELLFQDWPNAAAGRRPSGLFDTMARHSATKQLGHAVMDKRRGKLAAGERLLLETNTQCRPIPVVLAAAVGASAVPAAADPHAASSNSSASSTWTLLVPRTCINTIWHRLHQQRLRSGQRLMWAGVEEERHMALERGQPWFPADFPGTPTGWDWELQSRRRQEKEWNDKPTAKRTQWKAVDLGRNGPKGELGSGFACDWEFLFGEDAVPATLAAAAAEAAADAPPDKKDVASNDAARMDVCEDGSAAPPPVLVADSLHEDVQFAALRSQSTAMPAIVRNLQHATWADIRAAVQTAQLQKPVVWRSPCQLMTISVQLLWGGVPDARARVYRLPTNSQARQKWLALAECTKTKPRLRPPPPRRMPAEADISTRKKLLAQSLLETRLPYPRPSAERDAGAGAEAGNNDSGGGDGALHPPIPGRDDLMGFVTSGAHRLQSGKGFGIGHVSAQRLVEAIVAADSEQKKEGAKEGENMRISRESRFCIVRNAGERVGHLARWTPISN
ncbi:Ribonucleases P/MRP protein subunit pop1 [Sporothrix curviconia]|uniref:Ribonucleases P/MRP protein subunit pop1 n=1 Tax=Sporothrix curviconia TaxID=1260050 RepID=A0ABP0BYP0_9PEZI